MIPASARVLIAVGPGDVVSQFQDWTRGIRTLTETSISYAMQSAEYCLKHGIEAHLVSCHARAEQAQEGLLHVANLPKPGHPAASGWRYHLREIRYAWMLAKYARQHRCQLAMIDSGTTHWFALFAFNVVGVPVVANFHNVYHPIGKPPQRLIAKLVCQLDKLFFRYGLGAMVGNSPECIRQAHWLHGSTSLPTREYRSQFVAEDFVSIPESTFGAGAFRVMFAGRLEAAKGIFDLLDISEQITRKCPTANVVFDICGTGSALDALKDAVVSRGLQGSVVIHGRLARKDMLARYAQSHLVIVPTRSDFGEGMPQVCAEAVLARRPVLSSVLSNAADVLGDALIMAPPEDIGAYADEIIKLIRNPSLHADKCRACDSVRQQFLDRRNGVGETIGWSLRQFRMLKQVMSE